MPTQTNIKTTHSILGRYVRGYGHAHRRDRAGGWQQICSDHEQEFPRIRDCAPGTFNVKVTSPQGWYLPEDTALRALARRRGRGTPKRYKDGNYVSPLAFVTRMGAVELTAWFYAGSPRHKGNGILELICEREIATLVSVKEGDEVELTVREIWTPQSGMPTPPVLSQQIILRRG